MICDQSDLAGLCWLFALYPYTLCPGRVRAAECGHPLPGGVRHPAAQGDP